MLTVGNHADQGIVGNAMKYTMTGFVKIELYYSSGQAILTVQDSGVGIPRRSFRHWHLNMLICTCRFRYPSHRRALPSGAIGQQVS